MNSLVSSIFNFWNTASSVSSTSSTTTTKLPPLLKTQDLSDSNNNIGNQSNLHSTNNQSSTSPRNNLQLVSSILNIVTTHDNSHHTHQTTSENLPLVWKTHKTTINSSSTIVATTTTDFMVNNSINSMQPNRDVSNFVLKARKDYSKGNCYNQAPSVFEKHEFSHSSPSLTVNTFNVDDSLIVKCMKSITIESSSSSSFGQFGSKATNNNSSSILRITNTDSTNSPANFHCYSPLPISTVYHACYYEVTLMSSNSPTTLCIGYGPMENDLHNHVGWFSESVALHTDDQRLRNSQQNSMFRVGGNQFQCGDTIGVYWDLNNDGMICFTKNGEFIDYKTKCRVTNSNDFLIALSGQVNGNSPLTFKLNVGNERFKCKHFNDLYHLSESQTKLSRMIDSEQLSDIFIHTTSQ